MISLHPPCKVACTAEQPPSPPAAGPCPECSGHGTRQNQQAPTGYSRSNTKNTEQCTLNGRTTNHRNKSENSKAQERMKRNTRRPHEHLVRNTTHKKRGGGNQAKKDIYVAAYFVVFFLTKIHECYLANFNSPHNPFQHLCKHKRVPKALSAQTAAPIYHHETYPHAPSLSRARTQLIVAPPACSSSERRR